MEDEILAVDEPRVVIVGDPGSGKTSICNALKGLPLEDQLPSVVPPFRCAIPSVGAGVEAVIIDTSSRDEDRADLLRAMRSANAIIIAYDLTNPGGLERVKSHWIEMIMKDSQISANGVLIVGTKQDLLDDSSITNEIQKWDELNDQYAFLEGALACSAKTMCNIDDSIHIAVKAALYPRAPLFDEATDKLTPSAVTAFKRIFRLCDRDFDGLLNDEEINYFQWMCGYEDRVLSPEEIRDLKQLAAETQRGGIEDFDKGITELGFLGLMHIYFKKGRLDVLWDSLRRFGYDNDLNLVEGLTKANFLIPYSYRAELTDSAIDFLNDIFTRADRDGDSLLTEHDIAKIMSICPQQFVWRAHGFPDCVTTTVTASGELGVDSENWIALWKALTALDYEEVFSLLSYLGYEHDSLESAASNVFTLVKRNDPVSPRKTFVAYLFGARGVGKTSLLRMFTGKPFEENLPHTKTAISAVKGFKDKTLVLVEVAEEEKMILEAKDVLPDICDVACLVYEQHSSTSFDYICHIVEYLTQHCPQVPIMLISTKADGDKMLTEQRTLARLVRNVIKTYQLNEPIFVSAKDGNHANLFSTILDVAERGINKPWQPTGIIKVMMGATVVGVVAGAMWAVSRIKGDGKSGGLLSIIESVKGLFTRSSSSAQ